MENLDQIITNAEREAEMGKEETPTNRSIRHLAEAYQDLNQGLQSPAEARAIIAKLDLILESNVDMSIKTEAQKFKNDIAKIYGRKILEEEIKVPKDIS